MSQESENTAAAPFQEGGASRQSALAKIDARVKILIAGAWSFAVSWVHAPSGGLVALGGAVVFMALARWPRKNLINRLLTVNVFFLFMWATLIFSFSVPGETVAALGPLKVTREGLALAVTLTLKGNAIVLFVLAILGTSPLHVLAAAGRKLHFPEKLVSLFILTVRYYQVMFNEYLRLRRAMRARGFKFNLSPNSLKGVTNLIGSLMVRSFDRAERVNRAMVSRGYMGVVWVRHEFRLKKIDLAFTVAAAALFALIGLCEWKL
jgi:cobalt/nickel transport system permease protein